MKHNKPQKEKTKEIQKRIKKGFFIQRRKKFLETIAN